MTLEIETTRGLAAQILRHRSFTYQEFSQRYADVSYIREDIPLPELRSQDTKNRQNSIDDVDPDVVKRFNRDMRKHFDAGIDLYKSMLHAGIAKECARFVLPLATPTKIYMTGSGHGTQKEHMDIANECKKIFSHTFPVVAEALAWV